MEAKDKVEFWLRNLKLFALNSEVHCSREEKIIKQELIGTRNVNLAFNEMIKHMHSDMGFQYENIVKQPIVIKGGKQILLFTIGMNNYYTDISAIHEIITYPTRNYNQFKVNENPPMVAILNWYEGLVPVIQTHKLIEEELSEENYLLIYDINKEIYAFTITKIYPKHEIDSSLYGKEIEIDDKKIKYLDFSSYEKQLIDVRMKLKM